MRGVPGDVGGRARGAELTECAPRLWAREDEGICVYDGDRVFVKVIVAAKGSPAKYADWEGVIATRIAESESASAGVG